MRMIFDRYLGIIKQIELESGITVLGYCLMSPIGEGK